MKGVREEPKFPGQFHPKKKAEKVQNPTRSDEENTWEGEKTQSDSKSGVKGIQNGLRYRRWDG